MPKARIRKPNWRPRQPTCHKCRVPDSWESVVEVSWRDGNGSRRLRWFCSDCAFSWLKFYGDQYEVSEKDRELVQQLSLFNETEKF